MKYHVHVNEKTTLVAYNRNDADDHLLANGKGLDEPIAFFLHVGNAEGEVLDRRNVIGYFTFSPMPGCCGIVVSSGTHLNAVYRKSEFSEPFRVLKEELAKKLGYGAMIATGNHGNVASHKNLIKSKYELTPTFRNPRTGNTLEIGYKFL